MILNIIIIVWLGISLFSGLKLGFVYKAGTTIGFIFGVWLSSRWTPGVASWLGGSPLTVALVFLFFLSIMSKLFGGVAWLLDKVFKILALLPGLKSFNRVLGGLLSVLLSCFIISAGLFIAVSFSEADYENNSSTISASAEGPALANAINESSMARSLLTLKIFYQPLLSDVLATYLTDEKTSE